MVHYWHLHINRLDIISTYHLLVVFRFSYSCRVHIFHPFKPLNEVDNQSINRQLKSVFQDYILPLDFKI